MNRPRVAVPSPFLMLTPEQIEDVIGRAIAAGVALLTPPEVLTREEAADLLRISMPSLMGHVERDALPAHRVGVQWRFRRTEVLQWLAGRGIEPGKGS